MSEFYEIYIDETLKYCEICGGNYYHNIIPDIHLTKCSQCRRGCCGYCIDSCRICINCEPLYYPRRNIFQKMRDYWYSCFN